MHDDHATDDHDRGLAHDLTVIARRRALHWVVGAGAAALIGGCGRTSAPAIVAAADGAGGCIADPAETSGPFPADGSNIATGPTSNALTASGIVRSDLRSGFLATGGIAAGVKVTLTLTLVNVNASCTPLAGHAIYLWHCDRRGQYSLYDAAAEQSYLRGVQVTDANGQVTFTTIFPAAYPGRWPHMHLEIFPSLAAATNGARALLTSQLAMPKDVCDAVFADTATYPSSKSTFAETSLANDNVFGDNTGGQLAQQTPSFSRGHAHEYIARATIGLTG